MNKNIFYYERLSLGYTQERVANDLKVERSWLARIEKDYLKAGVNMIIKLAAYYNIGAENCKIMVKEKTDKKVADFLDKKKVLG